MRHSLGNRTTILAAAVALSVSACSYFVSWNDISEPLIGHPFQEITEFESWRQPDEVKTLPNGDKEYKYHLKKIDPSCIHYWVVDPQGIIRGYHYEGRCRPIG